MSNVIVKENESLDSALRRFKRNCAKAGIQQEIRKREHYEKPSVKRKKKSEAARKRKFNQYYYDCVNPCRLSTGIFCCPCVKIELTTYKYSNRLLWRSYENKVRYNR